MKQRTNTLFFFVCLLALVQARATTLPNSCGSDKVKFNVSTRKGQPAPAAPEAGMAQVAVIETSDYISLGRKVTTRVGLDGAWIGADNGDSYFTFAVTPGEHHLCTNWQSSIGGWDKMVGLQSFNAEAGKIYYFHTKVTLSKYLIDFNLLPLNEDEGKYMVKTSGLSTATAKK